MKTRYEIAEDISEAATLPGKFYRDVEAFEILRERVFARSWQWVGHETELERGSAKPLTLLDGCLSEPVVLTRDDADELRCLSNVCTHRANIIATEAGPCKKLRCCYHGRRYTLDGKFDFMPEFEGAVGFPSEADNLPNLSLESAQGFLFTSLDSGLSIDALLGDMLQGIGHLPLSSAKLDAGSSRDYSFDANWALYVDNFLEGFHVPYIHPGLIEALDYANYRTELFPLSNLQVGIGKGAGPEIELRDPSGDQSEQVAAAYYWLFPNTMFNVYPWGISVNVVIPQAVDRTRVLFRSYVWDPKLQEQGAGSALDQVQKEDEVVVLQAQRGIGSRLYERGRYSPARETAVHHFHRLLCSELG